MEVQKYQRKNTASTIMYKVVAISTIGVIIYTLAKGYYDYSFLGAICLVLVEFFLNPQTITIENATLIVTSNHLAGLYKRSINIEIRSISKIISIGLDNSVDAHPDTGTGIFNSDSENGLKPFDLYQIEYFDSKNDLVKIKLNLLLIEISKLQEMKQIKNQNIVG